MLAPKEVACPKNNSQTALQASQSTQTTLKKISSEAPGTVNVSAVAASVLDSTSAASSLPADKNSCSSPKSTSQMIQTRSSSTSEADKESEKGSRAASPHSTAAPPPPPPRQPKPFDIHIDAEAHGFKSVDSTPVNPPMLTFQSAPAQVVNPPLPSGDLVSVGPVQVQANFPGDDHATAATTTGIPPTTSNNRDANHLQTPRGVGNVGGTNSSRPAPPPPPPPPPAFAPHPPVLPIPQATYPSPNMVNTLSGQSSTVMMQYGHSVPPYGWNLQSPNVAGGAAAAAVTGPPYFPPGSPIQMQMASYQTNGSGQLQVFPYYFVNQDFTGQNREAQMLGSAAYAVDPQYVQQQMMLAQQGMGGYDPNTGGGYNSNINSMMMMPYPGGGSTAGQYHHSNNSNNNYQQNYNRNLDSAGHNNNYKGRQNNSNNARRHSKRGSGYGFGAQSSFPQQPAPQRSHNHRSANATGSGNSARPHSQSNRHNKPPADPRYINGIDKFRQPATIGDLPFADGVAPPEFLAAIKEAHTMGFGETAPVPIYSELLIALKNLLLENPVGEDSTLQTPTSAVAAAAASRGPFPNDGELSQQQLDQLRECKESLHYETSAGVHPLSELRGHLAAFARDSIGSKLLKSSLCAAGENGAKEDIEGAYHELKHCIKDLSVDVFGNYVVQALIINAEPHVVEEITTDIIIGRALAMSLHVYGCRVVQAALDVATPAHCNQIASELAPHVLRCAADQNANHVIQKCMEVVDPSNEHALQMATSIVDKALLLAHHSFGCRLVQRIFAHCTDKELVDDVTSKVLSCVLDLCNDQYGNYVVQHLVEKGSDEVKATIYDSVLPCAGTLSCHKYASNVMEACLKSGSEEQVADVINALLKYSPSSSVNRAGAGAHPFATVGALSSLANDKFGNYVLQKAFDFASPAMRHELASNMLPYIEHLKRSTYGKHLIYRVTRATVPPPPPPTPAPEVVDASTSTSISA